MSSQDKPSPKQYYSHCEVDKYMSSRKHCGSLGVHMCHVLNKLHPNVRDGQVVRLSQENLNFYKDEFDGGSSRFSEQELIYMQCLIWTFGDGAEFKYDN